MTALGRNVVITGGTITVHNTDGHGGRSEEEREALKHLYDHSSPDAFHDARERSREVDNQSVGKVVDRWTHLQGLSSFAAFAVEDVLRDIFNWVCDPHTPSMWVNGNDRTQTALIAQAVANILSKRGELSASFFFSQATGSSKSIAASVIPSIAYQLAEKIDHARGHILHASRNDLTIFDPRLKVQAQMQKLITDPLWKAFESPEISHPIFILVHALEDCEDEDDFQASLLDAFSQALEQLKTKLPLKLLVLGQHTTHLSHCFARLAGRSMVLRRPIDSVDRLVVEEEIYQKEIALRKWEEELEQKKKKVEKMEEQLKRRLDQREHQSEHDYTSSGGLGVYGGPSPDYRPINPYTSIGKQVPAGTSSPTSYQGNRNSIPSTALPPIFIPPQSDVSLYAGNSMSNSNSTPSTSRSGTFDRPPSNTQSPTTQQCGQPQLDAVPYRRYTGDSMDPSTKISPDPMSLSSSGSSNTGDGESYYVSSPISIAHNGRTPVQTTDPRGIRTLPFSSAIQEAIEDPESTWKINDDGVAVAGTLEGLVEFLVITIGSDHRKYKDHRDIFSMACAEVTTSDKLFQIITRRLDDGASPGVQVGQFKRNAFLVIKHWLELGYVPLDQDLRRNVKSLCEHAIQSKPEAAQLHGFTNLPQLVDQIVGQSAPPSLIGQGGIAPTDLQVEPRNLAIALSLLEGENYRPLRPLDYVLHLTKNWSEKINKFYEMNNKIKLWVIESILQYDDVHKRVAVMKYFIKTALECRGMGNISSATAVISAINSAPIRGLKATMKLLSGDKQKKLTELYKIIDSGSNYCGYWATLKSIPTAVKRGICIPWLKVHLIELQKVLPEHPVTIQAEGRHLINLERYIAFTARSMELLDYTPPSGGNHHQGQQLEYLLTQFRTITYPQGTDERQSERSAILQAQEPKGKIEHLAQLGFK